MKFENYRHSGVHDLLDVSRIYIQEGNNIHSFQWYCCIIVFQGKVRSCIHSYLFQKQFFFKRNSPFKEKKKENENLGIDIHFLEIHRYIDNYSFQ